MDEQDQATLLSTLSTQDTSSTRLYTQLLLALPLIPALLYLPRLSSLSTCTSSILSIISLLASAYTLYYLPLPPVRIRVTNVSSSSSDGKERREGKGKSTSKRRSMARTATGFSSAAPRHETPPVPYISDETTALLRTYIVPFNATLCVASALHELWQARDWSQGVMIGGGYIPGFVMGVVMWARRELRVVDLGELERLRYRSKGT